MEDGKMTGDPTNYKWGFLYYNLNDKRILVPKSFSKLGWTLNFAQPFSYVIIIGIIAFAILIANIGKM